VYRTREEFSGTKTSRVSRVRRRSCRNNICVTEKKNIETNFITQNASNHFPTAFTTMERPSDHCKQVK
jgi:hypothetical protein